MHRKILIPLAMSLVFIITAGSSYSADKAKEKPLIPQYNRKIAIKTIINPHNQISDEGEIIWDSCLVCHTNVPDVKKEKHIKDVRLRFASEGINEICLRCHQVKVHPASEGVSTAIYQAAAPDHMVVPRKDIALNMRLMLKDIPMVMPLDPKTGKIMCATCHNSHQRGILTGRDDYGSDYEMRLRTSGLDICQYCHRK